MVRKDDPPAAPLLRVLHPPCVQPQQSELPRELDVCQVGRAVGGHALVEQRQICRVDGHGLVVAIAQQLAVADVVGPELEPSSVRTCVSSAKELPHSAASGLHSPSRRSAMNAL